MTRLWAAVFAVLGLSATILSAEKLKGNIWDLSPLVVDGVEVALTPDARVERKGAGAIAPGDLRVGWRVEVEGTPGEGGAFAAERIRVETRPGERVEIRGYVEGLDAEGFRVGGERVRWGRLEPADIPPRRYLEGRGRRLDDGAVELEKYRVEEPRRDGERTKLLALAVIERQELESRLPLHEDRLFEDYVARVGQSLVPDWIDGEELRFEFRVVDDPDLNVFALADGTILVGSGVLAALDDEAQLAAVLGHAVAHVAHEHALRSYDAPEATEWRGLGSVVSASTIDVDVRAPAPVLEGPSWSSALVEIGATVGLDAALHGYGDELEAEADRVGLAYLRAAGYDLREAPRAWQALARYASTRSEAPTWFLGRPSTLAARVASVTPIANRDPLGVDVSDPEALRRAEDAYARNVASLRRLNVAMDEALGEYRSAEAVLRRMLEGDAGDAVAHYLLGRVLWKMDGPATADAALGELRLAAELAPALAEPHREMGTIYDALGYSESAASAFERYLEMAPDAPDASEVEARARAARR